MKTITILGAMCASAAFAAMPVIDTSSVSVRQDGGKTVIIEYALNPSTPGDAEPAIITVDILTNAIGEASASVGGENLKTLSGDVNKLVAHGNHKILWSPAKEGLPEVVIPAAQVTARITAWPTNSPPTYWIIDLTQPSDRFADRYYPDVEQIPGTVTNYLYKTDRLVMRRIPSKGVTWKMGGSTTYGATTYHYVTFSYDYYMAIYEFTDAQYNHIRDDWSIKPDDALPVRWNYESWRGAPTGASDYNWPSNGHDRVNSTKVLGKLRTAVGGIQFDMSTSAEWEFACRAGSSTKYCNGDMESDLAKVAWYEGNAGSTTHEVGLKEPNAWGMYDMHGNAAEVCLDKCSKISSDPVWDPTGPMQDDIVLVKSSASKIFTVRGGGMWKYWTGGADRCTSFYIEPLDASESESGVRINLPLN